MKAKYVIGVWLSLVECLVRDQEAVGSNPVARTINEVSALADASFLFCVMRTHGLFYPIKQAVSGRTQSGAVAVRIPSLGPKTGYLL